MTIWWVVCSDLIALRKPVAIPWNGDPVPMISVDMIYNSFCILCIINFKREKFNADNLWKKGASILQRQVTISLASIFLDARFAIFVVSTRYLPWLDNSALTISANYSWWPDFSFKHRGTLDAGSSFGVATAVELVVLNS